MNKENFALETFKNIQELIRFLDQKAAALLIVYGFILAALIESSKSLNLENFCNSSNSPNIVFSSLTILCGVILVLILLYQMYVILIGVIKPRFAQNYSKEEFSLFYYEHISNMSREKLFEEFSELHENQILNEIVGQIYEVAKITKIKTEQLSKSIYYLYFSILLLLLFILFSRFL